MLRGDRLRDLRLNKQYTHQELADLLDINIRQIARYESGETDPSSDVVSRIAVTFNVSTDYLLGFTDDPIPYALQERDLTAKEYSVVMAMRNGGTIEAIKVIVADE